MADINRINNGTQTKNLINHRIGEAQKFLKALEQNSVDSIAITYRHLIEQDFSVYDQIPADLLDVEFLKQYLRRHIRLMLSKLKCDIRSSNGNGTSQ